MIDRGVELQPGTWYFMKKIANFQTLKFESFTLIGPEINITVNLSEYLVDYPNYIPVDNHSLTYFVYAVRTSLNMQHGSTQIYVDDVEASIETTSGFEIILKDGFEHQQHIPDIPISLPITSLSDINEYYWYKDNEFAKLNITDEISRSGNYSCLCDVTFEGLRTKKISLPLFGKNVFP